MTFVTEVFGSDGLLGSLKAASSGKLRVIRCILIAAAHGALTERSEPTAAPVQNAYLLPDSEKSVAMVSKLFMPCQTPPDHKRLASRLQGLGIFRPPQGVATDWRFS